MTKKITKKPMARKATTKPATKVNGKSPAKAKPAAKPTTKGYGQFRGKKLFPSAAVKKANPRQATAKDRSGKVRESNGHRALELIRKRPGITYEEFVAAGMRPADLRWDVKLGRVEVRP